MSSVKKAHLWFEKGLQAYNLIFFLVMAVLWVYFSVTLITTQPFKLWLFWDAFNIIYSNIVFETGCIFFVALNTLYTGREMVVQYYDAKEGFAHARTVTNFVKRKR